MFMDSLISINTDGLAKLAEIVVHCTGLHARGIKKDADAQCYADEVMARSANNVALIKEQGNEALADYVFQREQRKASNVVSIVQKAADQFVPGEQVPEECPSEDWLNRFFDYAESISEEDMQDIWAKLLAGEIKQPKSFSKRTLDVIRNLSSEEAQLMNKYSGRVFGNNLPIMKNDDNLNDLTKLDDSGLLNINPLSYKYSLKEHQKTILCADKHHLVEIYANSSTQLYYDICVLTEAGREIIQLIDPDLDLSFIEKLADTIVEKFDVNISLYDLQRREGNTYVYNDTPICVKKHSQIRGGARG